MTITHFSAKLHITAFMNLLMEFILAPMMELIAWAILLADFVIVIILFFKKNSHWKTILFCFIVIFVVINGYQNSYLAKTIVDSFAVLFNLSKNMAVEMAWLILAIYISLFLAIFWMLQTFIDKIINLVKGKTDMQKVTVMLLGPEAVGKTNLLATMHNEIINDAIVEFSIRAEQDTMVNLQKAFTKLREVIKEPNFKDIRPLMQGNAGITEHQFQVWLNGQSQFAIQICDIPGGYMRIEKNHEDYYRFNSLLNETTVFINVIDGVALMEGDPLYFDERATPMMAKHFLEIPGDRKNCLILFVVTKCEYWLKTPEERNKLQDKFDERYKAVINLINKPENQMVGVLIPVKTLGCVEFARFDLQTNKPVFEKKPRLDFKPEFVDQPLRYALTFALSQQVENRGFFEKIRGYFGTGGIFEDALRWFKATRDRTFKKYGKIYLID